MYHSRKWIDGKMHHEDISIEMSLERSDDPPSTTVNLSFPVAESLGPVVTIRDHAPEWLVKECGGFVEACWVELLHDPRGEKRSQAMGESFEHGFVAALHYAFSKHVPLELAPHDFWLLVLQGVGKHESQTQFLGEKYDELEPNSKIEIAVRRDEFILGSPANDWPSVFPEFETQICENLPESLRNAFVPEEQPSTMKKIARICSVVTLMDTMQNYFNYRVMTLCGIPKIILNGTPDDWALLQRNIRALAEELEGVGLNEWFALVESVMEKIVRTVVDGVEDTVFWNSIYKFMSESGSACINGWICAFFPYVSCRGKEFSRLKFPQVREDYTVLNCWEHGVGRDCWSGGGWEGYFEASRFGIDSSSVPGGLSCAPFTWTHIEEGDLPYKFMAGFFGIKPNEEGTAIMPSLGYAVIGSGPKWKGEGEEEEIS